MKLPHVSPYMFNAPRFALYAPRSPRRREQGMAVIVVMALIVLILIYVMGTLRTFNALGRELKLLERQQTQRLRMSSPATNAVPTINLNTNSVSRSGGPQPAP